MGKGNVCVIYDPDERYAKRLMGIINGINKIMGEAKIMEICMKMWAGIYKEIYGSFR